MCIHSTESTIGAQNLLGIVFVKRNLKEQANILQSEQVVTYQKKNNISSKKLHRIATEIMIKNDVHGVPVRLLACRSNFSFHTHKV